MAIEFWPIYVEPYNFVTYWSRPMTDVLAGNPIAPHAWVAGYYAAVSSAYHRYCESSETGSGEYFSGNSWTTSFADVLNANPKLNNCWDDAVLTFDLATYLPASIG